MLPATPSQWREVADLLDELGRELDRLDYSDPLSLERVRIVNRRLLQVTYELQIQITDRDN